MVDFSPWSGYFEWFPNRLDIRCGKGIKSWWNSWSKVILVSPESVSTRLGGASPNKTFSPSKSNNKCLNRY